MYTTFYSRLMYSVPFKQLCDVAMFSQLTKGPFIKLHTAPRQEEKQKEKGLQNKSGEIIQ